MDERERRVIATFVKGGVIPSFPVKLSRQIILWRWVVERFEVGRDYPESERNRILRPINPDVATVRRALVDHGLMMRQGGVYRRLLNHWVTSRPSQSERGALVRNAGRRSMQPIR